MIEVSVCIVNYNTKDRLKECIDSIYYQTKGIDYELIVVDNSSRDGSCDMVKCSYPEVILIANEENKGFARANNQAIRKSRGKYLLFLNPDTVLLSNVLVILRDFFQKYPQAGAVGCRLLNRDGSLQTSSYRFPTLIQALGNIFLLNRILPYQWLRANLGYKLGNLWGQFDPHDRIREVDYVTGACIMVRKDLLDKIGLFDPKFFLYFEEKDLCLRLKKAGWRVYFTPQASVMHYIAEASKLNKKYALFHRYRSMVYFYRKHYNRNILISLKGILTIGCIYRMLLSIIGCLGHPDKKIYLKDALTLWGSILKIAWWEKTAS
jgi:hypothetical protein